MILIAFVFSYLLATGFTAPPYVMVKGPLQLTDHFAASLMSPNGNSQSQSQSQSVPRPPALPNPPQSPRPPSSSQQQQQQQQGSSPQATSSISDTVVSSEGNPCPKDMIQSANLNGIEVIERDACCPNSIGVFAGPTACCALEHKSCTHTARCCDSSLECNAVPGASMQTCERVGVFTGSETTPSSSQETTPVSETGSNISGLSSSVAESVSG